MMNADSPWKITWKKGRERGVDEANESFWGIKVVIPSGSVERGLEFLNLGRRVVHMVLDVFSEVDVG